MEVYLEDAIQINMQMTIGRALTIAILDNLVSVAKTSVNRFRFKTFKPGIRPDQEIILDLVGQEFALIPMEWLQDAPNSPEVRIKILIRLISSIVARA